MKRYSLEPGLLSTFRMYTAVRLIFIVLAAGFYILWHEQELDPRAPLYVLPFLPDVVFLLVYLSVPWLERHMGRVYLPLALLIASISPIVEVNYVRHTYGLDGATAFLLGFSFLLVPLILTAWQYELQHVVLYSLGTTLFELFLLGVTSGLGPVARLYNINALLGRLVLSIFCGYIVSNLVTEQRNQRHELAQANRKLVRYASTLEQLAVSRERNRLARELHDTLAHALGGLAVQLDAIGVVWDPIPPKVQGMLDRSLSLARIGLDETRRALHALRAAPLEDLGLPLAIRSLAEDAASRGAFELELDLSEPLGDLSPEVEQATYRVAQEALENVARHANAHRVRVSLAEQDGQLVLRVSDDGAGFVGDAGLAPDSAEAQGRRYGLQGMLERAELIGGTLEVQTEPGKGTTICLRKEIAL